MDEWIPKFRPEQRRYLINSCGVTKHQVELLELALPEAAELIRPKAHQENMERKYAKDKIKEIQLKIKKLSKYLESTLTETNSIDFYLSSAAQKYQDFNLETHIEKFNQKKDSINLDPKILNPNQFEWLEVSPNLFSKKVESFLEQVILICDNTIEYLNNISQSHDNTIIVIRLIELALDRELKHDNRKDEDIVSEFYQAIKKEAGTKLKNYNEWRLIERKNILLRSTTDEKSPESTQENYKAKLARLTGIIK